MLTSKYFTHVLYSDIYMYISKFLATSMDFYMMLTDVFDATYF